MEGKREVVKWSSGINTVGRSPKVESSQTMRYSL